MNKIFRNKAFIIGFANGIGFFLCINLFIFFYSQCHHCLTVAGFPIIFWEKFVGGFYGSLDNPADDNFYEHFFAYKLFADILIAVFSSFVVGLIFKFINSKIVSRHLFLK